MKRIGLSVAVTAILASMIVPSVMACVTRTPGYWKNPERAGGKHSWPADSTPITLGDTTYDQAGLIVFLNTPPKGGNAWIIVAQKVIAAELSMAADGGRTASHWADPYYFDGDSFVDLVDAAHDWLALSTHTDEECLPGDDDGDRAAGLELADTIDKWLNFYDLD